MIVHLNDILPGIPPLSILTVVGVCIMMASLLLYYLSRIPEMLLITAIAALYGVVPLIGMVPHL